MSTVERDPTAAEVVEGWLDRFKGSDGARARGLVEAARMLALDGVDGRAPSARVTAGRVLEVVHARGGLDLEARFEEVARHLAHDARPAASHAWVEAPSLARTEAWARLLDALPRVERERIGLRLPDAESGALDALDHLIASASMACADCGAAGAVRWGAWGARVSWWRAGSPGAAAGGEAADRFVRLAAEVARAELTPPERSAWIERLVVDRLGLELDLGRWRAAAELARDAGCAHELALWARWGAGEGDVRPALEPAPESDTGQPARWIECAKGAESGEIFELDVLDGAGSAGPARVSRVDLGARAVVLLESDGAALRAELSDLAPGLAADVSAWTRSCGEAPGGAAGLAGRAARTGRALAMVRSERAAGQARDFDRMTIGGGRAPARMVLCIPLGPPAGPPAGAARVAWVECEHRLAPSPARLAVFRASCLAALASRPGARSEPAARLTAGPWARLLEGSTAKFARRRWAVVFPAAQRGALALVESGGDGPLGAARLGGAWGARQSMRTEQPLRYGPPVRSCALLDRSGLDEREAAGSVSMFEGAVAGAALPVSVGRVCFASVVVETAVRGDIGPGDVRRWGRGVRRAAPALWLQELERSEGGDFALGLDTSAPDGRGWIARLARAARAEGGRVLISGAEGSGRGTLARAVHAARLQQGRASELVLVEGTDAAADLAPALARVSGGLSARSSPTLVVRGVEALPGDAARRLEDWLQLHRGAPCAVVLTSEGTATSGPAAALGGWVWRLPDLVERRHWIPCILDALEREAARLGRPRARLDDGARAALWRQRWGAGVRELRRVRDVLAVRGERRAGPCSAMDVRAALGSLGLRWEGRLRPNDVGSHALAAVAWGTRTGSGRLNKTRAGLHLGWDPSTVAGRFRRAGLGTPEDARRILLAGFRSSRALER